ncbi:MULTISPECIES: nucleotidyltransferase family protein [unclassified Brevundimonas]|uniref:nucleotidyltransferase family protein n=1 Tax=unclassified Brevundimonas TaxID=2622653 RepID=UPI000E96F85D|nr:MULTISPECIES: nucleotidyltransferase family protein [unclassified Brevundimonas]MCK6105342.1 nucleotidyltransferase family protein [Brevundimonas sp. EYE_349]HBI20620.1 hypothetical protein [Brevundimonas sp.]
MSDVIAEPTFEPPADALAFYAESLGLLKESGIPFLLSGTYAVTAYTGIRRPTKDLDVFCKPGDYPRILAFFQKHGYRTDVEDERWIAKVWKDEKHFFDVIFAMSNGTIAVSDSWFSEDRITVYGHQVQITPPTALILSKVFIQDRYRYDGADVNHVILKQSDAIDWKSLLDQMDLYWEVLAAHLLNFRFAYPTERDRIPRWLMEELVERLTAQIDLPAPRVKVCRGRLFSPRDYVADVAEWGFGDVVGKGLEERHDPVNLGH